jgi:hypothetical protein
MSVSSTRTAALRALRQQLQKSVSTAVSREFLPTGLHSLDAILPDGGLPTAAVVEWICDQPGIGGASLALQCARPFLQMSGCLAIVDGNHEFHGTAAVSSGIAMSRILLIRPENPADSLWALEQIALSAGVRVVMCWLDRVSSTVLRRLQLAVERSGVTVFLIRSNAAMNQPSWSDLRLHMKAETAAENFGTIAVRVLRSRHAVQHAGQALLKIDHETGVVHSICGLADSAAAAAAQH